MATSAVSESEIPTTVNFAPAEMVRSLSPEDKHAVFLALLREALQYNGEAGLLAIDDEDGKPFGYYVPPNAAAAHAAAVLPSLLPEREAELVRRHHERGRMLTEQELRIWLSRATPAQSQ